MIIILLRNNLPLAYKNYIDSGKELMRKESKNKIEPTKFKMENDKAEYDKKVGSNIRVCFQDNLKKNSMNNRQSLPPIASPFLKKTVYGLFSDKNFKQILPLVQNQEEQSSTIMRKCHNYKQPIDSPMKTQDQQDTYIQRLSNETDLRQRSKKLSTSKEQQNKFIKSISEVKHHSRQRLDHQISSKQPGPTLTLKNGRISTENSNINSKSIYIKLKDLNDKQQVCGEGRWRPRENASTEARIFKAPNFVTKHKMTKQLYGSQREDIKLLKSILKPSKGGAELQQVVRVKNYTKFMPGVICISK